MNDNQNLHFSRVYRETQILPTPKERALSSGAACS